MSYMVLFIWFVLLIRKEREKFGDLSNHIIAFFTVMLAVLMTNLILNLVFYFNFSPNVDKGLTPEQYQDIAMEQERLVSITTYLHTGEEIVFNIVMLVYLIAIAVD